MNTSSLLATLRIAIGCFFFYAGIVKVMNPAWSAAGFLNNAKTFPEFYAWFAQPGILPWTNLLNEWSLTLVGVALILGIGVRLASFGGILLMALYYFPSLSFPYAGDHAYIVDEHVIYALLLAYLAAMKAGRVWGLERWCANLSLCTRFPKLRALLG
ncbi:DoxX family protein [Candidatus Parcubacteria bacterium]|nr:DoxX family protein [Candidatus Parcubacteria bacterium]